jgi:hypothetical protein
MFNNHKEQLGKQMDTNAELRKKNQTDYVEEGRKLRTKQEEEQKKISSIQAKKMNRMGETGRDAKFQTQLGRKKFVPQWL